MNICYQCGSETTNPKFCSRRCSVKANNKLRIRTIESRNKTSETLKKFQATIPKEPKLKYTRVYFKICHCGETFYGRWPQGKFCPKCRTSVRIKNGLKSKHIIKNGVHFDSSWEVTIAEYLDKRKIEWFRPNYIKYVSENGQEKRYFADFFLPKYNIYLDPKNPYGMIKDSFKINQIKKQVTLFTGSIEYIMARLEGLEPPCFH